MVTTPQCAHVQLRHGTRERDGILSGAWVCTDCGRPFDLAPHYGQSREYGKRDSDPRDPVAELAELWRAARLRVADSERGLTMTEAVAEVWPELSEVLTLLLDWGSPSLLSMRSASAPDGTWRRLTWREVAEGEVSRRDQLDALATILFDLDRCEHGRHEGEHCSGCKGPSAGNPMAHAPDRVLGYGLSGRPIRYPTREGGDLYDPASWRPDDPNPQVEVEP